MNSNLFCQKCFLQFDKKYVFDLHLSLVHGEKIEVKKEPGNFQEKFQEPQIREKEFSDPVMDKHKCEICNTPFKKKESLKNHIASVHERKKPFKCSICDVSFTSKQNMSKHISSVHQGMKHL